LLILQDTFYDDPEVLFTNRMEIEGKAMPFSKIRPYIEKRINQEPENGELRLRYANFLRRVNEHDKAIKQYKKSLELNGNLLASLLSLTDIFYRRSIQYKEKGAMTKAREYFEEFVALFESGNADLTTLTDEETILLIIEDRKEVLYPKKKKKKRKKR
jgi:tetratricopeptide (TPR) repeat protein